MRLIGAEEHESNVRGEEASSLLLRWGEIEANQVEKYFKASAFLEMLMMMMTQCVTHAGIKITG